MAMNTEINPCEVPNLGRQPDGSEVDLAKFVNRVLFRAAEQAPSMLLIENPLIDDRVQLSWYLYAATHPGSRATVVATVETVYFRTLLAYLIHSVIGGGTYHAGRTFKLVVNGREHDCLGLAQNTLGAFWASITINAGSQQSSPGDVATRAAPDK